VTGVEKLADEAMPGPLVASDVNPGSLGCPAPSRIYILLAERLAPEREYITIE